MRTYYCINPVRETMTKQTVGNLEVSGFMGEHQAESTTRFCLFM